MRSGETDLEVEALVRAWIDDHPVAMDLEGLEREIIVRFNYTLEEARAVYRPILQPVVSPKAEVIKPPARVRQVVARDNLSRQSAIDEDIARMRAYALTPDPAAPGGQRIKFPMIYAAMIDKAQRALETNIKIGAQLYDLDRVRNYVKGLGEIIFKHSSDLPPHVQDAIFADIERLNQEFTSPGRVPDVE